VNRPVRRPEALSGWLAECQPDRAGLPRQRLDIGDPVLVSRGPGELVQVLAVQFGRPGRLLPVPVGGVRLADLSRVAFQRGNPLGQGRLGELGGVGQM
jgi:hypothetical protein